MRPRVVVTRPRAQAAALVAALEAQGAEAVPIPVIEIVDPDDGGESLRQGLESLGAGDWLVLTSPNGAERVAAALSEQARGSLHDGVNVAVIGPGTQMRAEEAGLRVDLVPTRAIAEGLLEVFPDPPAAGGRVVLARARVARSLLHDQLGERGWTVADVAAYQTVGLELDDAQLDACRTSDVVAFTSSSTVTHLVAAAGVDNLPPVVACIGPATAAAARDAGVRVDVEASDHTVDGLVTAIYAFIEANG